MIDDRYTSNSLNFDEEKRISISVIICISNERPIELLGRYWTNALIFIYNEKITNMNKIENISFS